MLGLEEPELDAVAIPALLGLAKLTDRVALFDGDHMVFRRKISMHVAGLTVTADDPIVLGSEKLPLQGLLERAFCAGGQTEGERGGRSAENQADPPGFGGSQSEDFPC